MRIQEYIARLQARNALQKNDKVLVVLNDKPLVAYSNADNEEGWVDVPNLAPAKVAMTKNKPEAPVRVDIESKRLKGKVEFVIFRPLQDPETT